MSFVWRSGETTTTHTARTALGPRIGITCQVVLGLVYFVLVIRTFRNYGEVGRKARVVQRLADVAIELETTRRDDGGPGRARVRVPAQDGEATRERERGRSRAGDGGGEKVRARPGNGNELGLSGIDRKQEAMVTVANAGDVANDSYSSLGM
jgi:hypothetical protein